MDYKKEYENYLTERKKLNDAGEDTTAFIREFSKKVDALPKLERTAFMQKIMEIERERTERDLKELKEQFGIEVELPSK